MVPRPLATAIVVVVCLVWVGNFAATVFVHGYQNDSSINFVFATIVGGSLALRRADHAGGGASVLDRIVAVLRSSVPPPPPPPATPPPPASQPEGDDRP